MLNDIYCLIDSVKIDDKDVDRNIKLNIESYTVYPENLTIHRKVNAQANDTTIGNKEADLILNNGSVPFILILDNNVFLDCTSMYIGNGDYMITFGSKLSAYDLKNVYLNKREEKIMSGGEFYSGRSENNEHKAVVFLDAFTKTFCIDANVKDDLVFRCKECHFADGDMCRVKQFKNKFDPDYKDFGSMGDH